MKRKPKKQLPPTRGKTPKYAVRIPTDLRAKAGLVADALNMTFSELTREALNRMVVMYEPLIESRRDGLPSSLRE